MYQALGIMMNKTDNSICPYGTYAPVGGYFNTLEGDKCYRYVGEIDGHFKQSGQRRLHRVTFEQKLEGVWKEHRGSGQSAQCTH